MAKRVVIAGILGGLTMFVWLFVAHEFLGLEEVSVNEIPNEAAVLSVMQSSITTSGFYIYPGFGLGANPTSAQRNAAMPAYMKKYEQSPHGILIYNPPSRPFNFGKLLATQGGLNLLEGLLVAWLFACAAADKGYGVRAGVVVLAGVLACITTNLEYWNWYDFPGPYIAAYMVTQSSAMFLWDWSRLHL